MQNVDFKKKHPELLGELRHWYERIKLVKLRTAGCGNCVIDAFFELRSYSINQIINKMTLLHKLKPNKVYERLEKKVIDGKKKKVIQYYCNESKLLTNEICAEIYKIHPTWFEFYDENWKPKEVIVNVPKVKDTITTEQLEKVFNLEKSVIQDKVVADAINTANKFFNLEESVVPEEKPKVPELKFAGTDFTKMKYQALLSFAKTNNVPLKSKKMFEVVKTLQEWQ